MLSRIRAVPTVHPPAHPGGLHPHPPRLHPGLSSLRGGLKDQAMPAAVALVLLAAARWMGVAGP
jgi:hypothetical protein